MGDLFTSDVSLAVGTGFDKVTDTDTSFENALEAAKDGDRLSVEEATELLTTGSDVDGINDERKRAVLDAADARRREVVGDEVTFVANLNNNVTTACDVGCLFCNFKDAPREFKHEGGAGFTKTVEESRATAVEARDRGVYEVCSVSGLHPALVLDEEHREAVEGTDGYTPPDEFVKDPGTYAAQIRAMDDADLHVHAVTPEEAAHARRGTEWTYREVYERLADSGLDTVPGTAAEILVDEVRDVICPNKIDTEEWIDAMRGAANAGLCTTATMMYGHVENARHRALHLKRVRDLQDETDAITEFVPLSFVHENTPLGERGVTGATQAEDELVVAVSRLFLDNIDNIQSSWVKYGDELGTRMLECGANDFMGTLLSEEITKRAGGDHGEFRSFEWYVDKVREIDRVPVERSTDYEERCVVDEPPYGPALGPDADGTPLLDGT
ncbi:MAG: 7,8-didemethyl-8-hydroxy-5-deazariboflavin synthase subunit CofH [Halobacteriales archaeon]